MKSWPLAPLVRVQPFTGLVIDVETWATAHDYHRRHHQLHLLALHGSGIARGLDVAPADPPGAALIIEPGVAIDDNGNVIIVPERQRLTLEPVDATNYIVLDYVESLPQGVALNGTETRGRMVEDYRIRVLTGTPEPHTVELARVQVAAGAGKLAVTAARRAAMPEQNEIDLRFRPMAQSRAATAIRIALVVVGQEAALEASHLVGVNNWLREVSATGMRYTLLAGAAGIPQADLLYVTGDATAKPSAAIVKAIREQVAHGAWLFVDACGPGTELIEGMKTIVAGDRDHGTEALALSNPFVFGQAPPGASTTKEIIWGERAVVSPRDFGCAWAGRRGDQPLAREHIRNALEFGVNLAVCAGTADA